MSQGGSNETLLNVDGLTPRCFHQVGPCHGVVLVSKLHIHSALMTDDEIDSTSSSSSSFLLLLLYFLLLLLFLSDVVLCCVDECCLVVFC